MSKCFALLVLLISVVAATSALAGTFKRVTRPECQYSLEGNISADDVKAIKAAIHLTNRGFGPTVCLNSPTGGSWTAAIEIAKFFRRGVGTYIGDGAECFSACAIIFMAGIVDENPEEPDGKLLKRTLHVHGNLGFHAPFVQGEGRTAEDAATSYRSAVKSISALIELGAIEPSLLVEMNKYGPDKYFNIDTVDKVGRWRIALAGYHKPSAINRSMSNIACKNVTGWDDGANPSVIKKPIQFPCTDRCTIVQPYRDAHRNLTGERHFHVISNYGGSTCVVTITTKGTLSASYSFTDSNGKLPEAPNGELYGWEYSLPDTPLRKLSAGD
jgi:hypothetical protein